MEKCTQLISGPRNISTALMYSFANRSDCSVADEPFYAHYLLHNLVEHPGKVETLASLPHTLEDIKSQFIFQTLSPKRPIYFIKNMAHHFEEIDDPTFMLNLDPLFLIRDPYQLIASFAQVIPNPTMLDIGLKLEWELFEYFAA